MSTKKLNVNAISEPSLIYDKGIEKVINEFENAKQITDQGSEFWFARDLMFIMGYKRWENFEKIIDKAIIACKALNVNENDHFRDVTKMIAVGKGGKRNVHEFALSRYASYLIAASGDPRKKPIAYLHNYLVIQSRRQEKTEEAERQEITPDERRVLLRDNLIEHNKKLMTAAKSSGVKTPLDFAIFQSAGYEGLYGGLTVKQVQKRKGLTQKQKLLDHVDSTELAANLFRATQTEERLKKGAAANKGEASNLHRAIGKKVRETMKEISGTTPEDLSAVEHVKEVRKRVKTEKKKKIG